MMVPAFLMKDQPRSHILRTVSGHRSVIGRRFLTNGAGSPEKYGFLKDAGEDYSGNSYKTSLGATHHAPLNNAPDKGITGV